jgi:hypothetical protein
VRLDRGTWLAAELERLRLDYEAGHAPARARALWWCINNHRPLPPWLAALQEEPARRPGRKGRAHSPAWRAEMTLRHALRHDAVGYCLRVLCERDGGWAALSESEQEGRAFKMAGELMRGAWAWGDRRQIAVSYRKVESALSAGDGRIYTAALREPLGPPA